MPIWKMNFVLCFCGFQYSLDGGKGHKPPCVFENNTLVGGERSQHCANTVPVTPCPLFSSKEAEQVLLYNYMGTTSIILAFSLGVVHGSNMDSICSQIQEMVDEQQKRTVWVPLSGV